MPEARDADAVCWSLAEEWREVLRGLYAAAGPCHDLAHVLRVGHLAERLARAEEVDPRLPVLAALFHDAGTVEGRDGHERASANLARHHLAAGGVPPEDVRLVVDAISGHRFAGSHREARTEVEAIFWDADKLDALGASGVGRVFMFVGEHGRDLTEDVSMARIAADDWFAFEKHWEEKLSLLPGLMQTDTGRLLASERADRMRAFCDLLRAEVEFAALESAYEPPPV